MTKAELIALLSDVPDDAEIYVWESYDAGCTTTNIARDDYEDGAVLLEGACRAIPTAYSRNSNAPSSPRSRNLSARSKCIAGWRRSMSGN